MHSSISSDRAINNLIYQDKCKVELDLNETTSCTMRGILFSKLRVRDFVILAANC